MPESTTQLIIQAQNGDMNAFRLLVEQHQHFAFNVAFRLLANDADARDVVQECFIRVWKNLNNFNNRNKFKTWLYRIITNLCYDELRRAYNKYKCNPPEKDDLIQNIQNIEDLEKTCTNADLADFIRCLSKNLKPKQRMVFVLRDLEDLPLAEIADILNTSVGTIKSNLYYARLNIRQKLEQLDVTP